MGGLATAAALRRVGIDVTVYEQATQFARLGAGIQIGCNAMKVLRGLGLEAEDARPVLLSALLEQPRLAHRRSQVRHDLRRERRSRNSARRISWRIAAILHAALASAVPDECVRLNHKLVGLDETGDGVRLTFADGATRDRRCRGRRRRRSFRRCATSCSAPRRSSFTGRIAYRTTYPAALLNGEKIDDCTKWWGEDRHIVIYYVKPDRSEIYLVTSQPEPEFRIESWSAKGDVQGIAQGIRRLSIARSSRCWPHVPTCTNGRSSIATSLDRWTERNVTLLGDACHPMTPYMAQGAAMAIEDAAVLSRCLDGVERDGVANAFRRFEATRKERTGRIQQTSRANTWLSGKTDADWVYGYDAWTVPLAA